MKVLVLIDAWFPFTGGAQIQIKNLIHILEKDYDCSFSVLHSPSANILVRFLWSIWVIPQAILFYRKHKFDLIHAHAYWPGIPGKIISKILNVPIIFTVHGSNSLDIGEISIKALLEKIILTKIHYNYVISVSSNFLKYKNVNKTISIIPNGVDVGSFDKVEVKKEKPYKILFVGRNDPVKGLIYLEKAMKLVKEKFSNAGLKIVSGGLNETELIKEYKSSHIFVLPSLSEGQPLTLLEAWAAKLPVIVSDVGDNKKMVRNGYNGYLVPSRDHIALSVCIVKLLSDSKRDLLGINGYNLVKNLYSWRISAQKTYEVYKKF